MKRKAKVSISCDGELPTDLFVSCFGADGRPEPDMTAGAQSSGADEQTDAGLLEHDLIVIVGVPHSPAGRVLGRIWRARCVVDQSTIAVRPHLKPIAVTGRHLHGHTNTDVEM